MFRRVSNSFSSLSRQTGLSNCMGGLRLCSRRIAVPCTCIWGISPVWGIRLGMSRGLGEILDDGSVGQRGIGVSGWPKISWGWPWKMLWDVYRLCWVVVYNHKYHLSWVFSPNPLCPLALLENATRDSATPFSNLIPSQSHTKKYVGISMRSRITFNPHRI